MAHSSLDSFKKCMSNALEDVTEGAEIFAREVTLPRVAVIMALTLMGGYLQARLDNLHSEVCHLRMQVQAQNYEKVDDIFSRCMNRLR